VKNLNGKWFFLSILKIIEFVLCKRILCFYVKCCVNNGHTIAMYLKKIIETENLGQYQQMVDVFLANVMACKINLPLLLSISTLSPDLLYICTQ